MKSLSWLPAFFLIFAAAAFAQQVQTSKSTLTLPDLGGATSENSLRQAKAIVEIALGELGADVAGLIKEETVLGTEVAAFQASQRAEQAIFDKVKGKYDARLAAYENIVAQLSSEILAYNALPPGQRDAGTLDQLSRRKAVSDREPGG